MGRSGYCCENENYGVWIGAVRSAIRGRRGQDFLRELLAALDALPHKRLITEELVTADGECCTLGAVALRRNVDVAKIDPYDSDEVGCALGIAGALAAEIEYYNDEYFSRLTPEERFIEMRRWIVKRIVVRPEEL